MARFRDLTGQRFGSLVVLELAPRQKPNQGHYWSCRCDCGRVAIVRGKDLPSGNTASCGCKQTSGLPKARLLTAGGNTMPMAAWSKRLGGSRMLVSARLALGWSVERAVTVPPQPRRRKAAARGSV